MAFVSNPSSSEDSSLGTDLSNINMEDEKHMDTTAWMPAKWKKYSIWPNSMKNTNEYLVKKLQYIQL